MNGVCPNSIVALSIWGTFASTQETLINIAQKQDGSGALNNGYDDGLENMGNVSKGNVLFALSNIFPMLAPKFSLFRHVHSVIFLLTQYLRS